MYLMELQPFSVNDGEGIRTTIFLAGCPLRCAWCSNPEGFRMEEQVGWYRHKCIGCGACVEACPRGIGIDLNEERQNCTACGRCVAVCPSKARTYLVRESTIEDVLQQIQKHRLFYAYSSGGITFSGGEATVQLAALDELSRRIYDMGYSMALETCGLFSFDEASPSLHRMDQIFIDLKLMDDEKHRQYTGVSNEKILQNIIHLADLPAEIIVRIPVVGGVNDDEANIRRSAAFVHEHLPKAKMELLPLHKLGSVKYEALGMQPAYDRFSIPDQARMARLREILREEGVEIADYR